LKLLVTYPARDDEAEMLDTLTSGSVPAIRPILDAARILQARRVVDAVALAPKARDYALDIIRATREKNPLVEYGASPRAAIGLVRAAKANAFMEGRNWVAPEDIKAVAPDVLRHRVILTYEADAERVTADDVIARILDTHRVP
jgi:MoxR-like ATPase